MPKKQAIQKDVTPNNYKAVAGEAWEFAKQRPFQAAAVTLIAGSVLGGLVATRLGRKILKTTAPFALPMVTRWVGGRLSIA